MIIDTHATDKWYSDSSNDRSNVGCGIQWRVSVYGEGDMSGSKTYI